MAAFKSGLGVIVDDAKDAARLAGDRDPQTPAAWLNPFWMQWSLGSPDRLLAGVSPLLRWVFHPLALLMAGLIYGFAALTLLEHWHGFTAASRFIFAPQNWIWMLVTWVLLKVVHEFAHGITCRHFGGSVRDAGVIFILFAPMAYVDVTSTWRFSSKWHRIAVASAGMLVELLIAALAMLLWARTDSGLTAQVLYNVIVMAGATSILFNANPLMRFDGYFILSDLLEIPNLYEEGMARMKRACSRLFYGETTMGFSERPSLARTWFLSLYGFAASCWKLVVCASLTVCAGTMFHGAGILLAVVGTLCWFGLPTWKMLVGLWSKYFEARPAFFRAALVVLLLVGGVWCAWTVVPNPVALRVPCVLDYESASHLRAESAGFVEEVFVENGQHVLAGDPLLRLENRELAVDISRLRAELRQCELRARAARDRHEAAEVQIELQKEYSIQLELDDKLAQQEKMSVVSPCEGNVVGPNLRSRMGTWVEKGEDLLVIGNEHRKELIVSIGHDEIREALPRVGTSVSVRLGSRDRIVGHLARVEPRASADIPHAALAATVGGSVAVKEVRDDAADDVSVEFHEPRFVGVVSILPEEAIHLFSGERGWVRIGRRSDSLGRWMAALTSEWFERRLEYVTAPR